MLCHGYRTGGPGSQPQAEEPFPVVLLSSAAAAFDLSPYVHGWPLYPQSKQPRAQGPPLCGWEQIALNFMSKEQEETSSCWTFSSAMVPGQDVTTPSRHPSTSAHAFSQQHLWNYNRSSASHRSTQICSVRGIQTFWINQSKNSMNQKIRFSKEFTITRNPMKSP
jgi:hypothetical protein